MAAKRLQVVTPDTPPPFKVRSILEAAESGSRLDELVAMRRRIARAMDDPNIRGADLAALSRRQLEIGREVDAMVAASDSDEVGDAASTPDEEFVAN